MKYDPKLNRLVHCTGDLQNVYNLLMYSLKHLRESAGLPLDKYEREGPLTSHDHAAIAIVEAINELGVHLEITPHQHNQLDLRDTFY